MTKNEKVAPWHFESNGDLVLGRGGFERYRIEAHRAHEPDWYEHCARKSTFDADTLRGLAAGLEIMRKAKRKVKPK